MNTINWIRAILWFCFRVTVESPIVVIVIAAIVTAIFSFGYVVGSR